MESDTLFPIVNGYLTEKMIFCFHLPYNKNLVLVGKSDGNLSLFDGIKYYDYQIKDDGYIRDNILSEGISIGDSLYAFSTLDGGAIVMDKIKQESSGLQLIIKMNCLMMRYLQLGMIIVEVYGFLISLDLQGLT